MTTAWRRFLLVGVLAVAGYAVLPAGLGRDSLFCLVAASSAAAIMVGVRRNRPAHPGAWYLLAAGITSWALASALSSWYQHVGLIETFPSPADVLYLATYPLLMWGGLLLARSRGPEYRPTALLDSTILTVGLGLLSWVFLIEPVLAADGVSILSRLVGAAYPLGNVLLFGTLARLARAPGAGRVGSRLLAGLVGVLLVFQSLAQASGQVHIFDAHSPRLNPAWLVAYVLAGAGALHPSMRALSAPAADRDKTIRASHLVGLATALLIGPAILGGELIADVPLHARPVVVASVILAALILVRMVRMVRQLQEQAESLGRLADTDYVTGLAICRRFTDRLGEFLGDADGQVAGFLLINVERFAEIHDTLGHQTGDAILHAIGVRLSERDVGRALVARMGGNTFGILDPSITSGQDALRAAASIHSALERPLDLPDLTVSVEVSVGTLLLPDDAAEPALALLRADVALSVARARSGRTARYGHEMESAGTLAPMLIGELGQAIGRDDIVVYYQPQVEICTGRVYGVEALARWQHPGYGLLGPDAFVPAAEQAGLIGPLLHYVLDRALLQCVRWRSEGLDLTVAVNLSVRNLLDPGLVDDMRSALQRHGLRAGSLELEITEGTAMVDPRRSIEVLGALADMGVMLSIDDYGTGHSSLAYLQRLPVRRLKIDRSFVTGMVDQPASHAIVRSTIELARVLRFDVVAEGVEDDATLLRLRDMKCYAAQGFGIGRPVPAPLLPELIRGIEERLPWVLGTPALSGARPGE